jgi:hypothetical protein
VARRRASALEPSLFPFLSVLAAVMGTLTLIITGMSKMALASPKQRVVLEQHDPSRKSPVHVECLARGILVHPPNPGEGPPVEILRGDFGAREGAFATLRSELELDPTRYLQLLVRAEGVGTFHDVRRLTSGTLIEVGYQPLFGDGAVRFEPRRRPR